MTQPTLRGKYRIIRLLGEGGMGSVYEAEDTYAGTRVALKVMRPEITKSTVFMARFEREVRASQSIRTPYIVEVLDAGADLTSGEPYMAMELLDGEDVKQLLKRAGGTLPPLLALKIAAQACLGLHAAHEQRIVHRDIKTANIFLARRPGGERIVKLLDFGIAKEKLDREMHAETAGLTRTGNMLGSPLYMSPEQVRGHKSIDHRADLWSLGIVLYETLTGRAPHQDAETLGELIITICSELPRPIQDIAPWVHPAIVAVVSGAIRFDPAQRYPTAAAMFESINALLQGDLRITEDMLRPLTYEERSVVAPRYEEAIPQGRQSMQAVVPPISSATGAGQQPNDAWRFDSAPWPAPPGGVPGAATGAGPRPTYPGAATGAGPRPTYPGAMGSSPGFPGMTGSSGSMPGFPGMTSSTPGMAAPSWLPNAPAHPAISGTTFSPTSESVRAGVDTSPQPPRSRAAPLIAAGVVLSLFGGAFLVYKLLGPADAPTADASAAQSAAAAAAQTAAPNEPRETVRVVSVQILPTDAAVLVDGQPVTPQDGRVEIKGALGSKHSVRVTAGGVEEQQLVAVLEDGAFPAKIEVVPKAPKPGWQQPGPKTQPTRAPNPGPPLDLRTNR